MNLPTAPKIPVCNKGLGMAPTVPTRDEKHWGEWLNAIRANLHSMLTAANSHQQIPSHHLREALPALNILRNLSSTGGVKNFDQQQLNAIRTFLQLSSQHIQQQQHDFQMPSRFNSDIASGISPPVAAVNFGPVSYM